MKKIIIIGAGQLGSRHLQALKSVQQLLDIVVIDSSAESLAVAQQRYDSVPSGACNHTVRYVNSIPDEKNVVDIAVVATSSNVRYAVVKKLLESHAVRYCILEKLLFQRQMEYESAAALFVKNGCSVWVNCPMRMMSFYHTVKNKVDSTPFIYSVSGSNYGLITNAIHYIDHMAYLTGCTGYRVDTTMLDPHPLESKRKGFLELNGVLRVDFDNGSHGSFTCFAGGTLPVLVEISSPEYRCLSFESLGYVTEAEAKAGWLPRQLEFKIPYQSQLTAILVDQLLSNGTCSLTPYPESMIIHVTLQNSLQAFLNTRCSMNIDNYPFT